MSNGILAGAFEGLGRGLQQTAQSNMAMLAEQVKRDREMNMARFKADLEEQYNIRGENRKSESEDYAFDPDTGETITRGQYGSLPAEERARYKTIYKAGMESASSKADLERRRIEAEERRASSKADLERRRIEAEERRASAYEESIRKKPEGPKPISESEKQAQIKYYREQGDALLRAAKDGDPDYASIDWYNNNAVSLGLPQITVVEKNIPEEKGGLLGFGEKPASTENIWQYSGMTARQDLGGGGRTQEGTGKEQPDAESKSGEEKTKGPAATIKRLEEIYLSVPREEREEARQFIIDRFGKDAFDQMISLHNESTPELAMAGRMATEGEADDVRQLPDTAQSRAESTALGLTPQVEPPPPAQDQEEQVDWSTVPTPAGYAAEAAGAVYEKAKGIIDNWMSGAKKAFAIGEARNLVRSWLNGTAEKDRRAAQEMVVSGLVDRLNKEEREAVRAIAEGRL